MNVGAWLRGLGLGQYEALFRDNEVELDVLPDLTETDLEKIGLPLGSRKRLMKAIAQLDAPRAQASAPLSAPATPEAAERRQLTVMFCDLVGSTALSARLDPEDMRQVIRAYQDASSGVVARWDGFVAKFMGDGILAYFGFPRAHEDDAPRAVHAALEIAEAVASLHTPARDKLAVRIGIATGLVVVGDLVGEGPAREQAVVGDTPNLAGRLQGLASPGGVVFSAATRRLIGDRFRVRDLGRHGVKGLAEPVEVWEALAALQGESRFEAEHTARLTGFVGRVGECATLREQQRRAWNGQGQLVMISGEAGIGKSRLSAWLAEELADTPHTRLTFQSSPYHRDSALYPFVQQIERASGITSQEPAEAKLEKLEALFSGATDHPHEVAPLIAAMLSIPLGGRYPPQTLAPAQQRRQTLLALLDAMQALARRNPVLMLFEDAHWADATSLELIDLAIKRLQSSPVLLLITFRPEFEPPWKGLDGTTEIALHRLDPVQAESLVERVTGGRKLPAEVLAQIIAKTDGVPLFVEELTKNVLESGLLTVEADQFRLDGPLPPLAIPSTLQDSLMARLDRLAAVKEIAQIGAAIGREFSYSLLHAVVDRDEATLRAALKQLEESGLVFRSDEPPNAQYAFKHALVQDTAYESLLKSRRQILHQRIAEALREKFAGVVEAQPELIAHHFTQAGLRQPAVEHWGKAGDLALRRSAFKEAIAHLGKAIAMSDADGASAAEAGKLKLQVAYANALIASSGYSAPETLAAFESARESASVAGGAWERFPIAYGLWVGSLVRGELRKARGLAQAFLLDAGRRPESAEAGVAHRAVGVTHWCFGEFAEARPHLEEALAIFDPERDVDLTFRFGQDAGVAAMFYLAATLWPLGEVDRARRLIEDMNARVRRLDHMGTYVTASQYGATYDAMRRDFASFDAHSREMAEIAKKHELPGPLKQYVLLLEGRWESQAGESAAGLAKMHRGVITLREQGVLLFGSVVWSLVARCERDAGLFDAALESLDCALSESEGNAHRWFDAEILTMRGEILYQRNPGDPQAAEQAFVAAIAIARVQSARSFELRATLALAKIYHATGRDADAHAALAPALKGFSPTPEFPEIAEALAVVAATKARAPTKGAA